MHYSDVALQATTIRYEHELQEGKAELVVRHQEELRQVLYRGVLQAVGS